MKAFLFIAVCISLFSAHLSSQVSFTLPINLCVNTPLQLSANTGTLPNPQYSWLASPNAVFSNSVAANTSITFSTSGNYTVLLVVISGTALAFTQNTINVIPNPSPNLVASSASICPQSIFSLSASPIAGANYSFVLPGPIVVANATSNVLQVNPPNVLPSVYEVSVELNGCVGTNTILLQQLQLQPQIVASQNAVCVGYNSTLTAFFWWSTICPTKFYLFNFKSNPFFTSKWCKSKCCCEP